MPGITQRERSRNAFERDTRPRRIGSLEARQLSQPRRSTLAERISATWAGLVEDGSAECPVCDGELRAAHGCTVCGAQLS